MREIINKIENNIPIIMGIVNVTPDSFYDGGKYKTIEDIKRTIDSFINYGVDVIDVGGESSRPGSMRISKEKELDRVLPAIRVIKSISNIPISIDTYKHQVALESLKEGVDIVNDITGLRDIEMIKVIAKYKAKVIIMHMNGSPETMQENPLDADSDEKVFSFLKNQAELAFENGIDKNDIFLDPGIGFGKTQELNIKLIKKLETIKNMGYYSVLGVSRKSLIGSILNVDLEDRLIGSILIHYIGVLNSANIIRTHDVKETSWMRDIFLAFRD